MVAKIKTFKPLHELKQKSLKSCTKDKLWTKQKNSGMEHVKMISVLVGACLPHCSLEWHHDEVAEVGDASKLKTHIKKRIFLPTKLLRSRISILRSRTIE